MKAILHTRYGGPDLLQLTELDKPAPKDNEVLIAIHATTVSTGDCNMRARGEDQRLAEPGVPPRSILEGRSRTVVSHRTSVAKRGQIAASDRRTLGGLTQFLTQFDVLGSATGP